MISELESILNPSKELLTDIGDLSLNRLIKYIPHHLQILEDIPYLNSLCKTGKIISGIQTAFFIKKYANFIGIINADVQNDKINAKKIVKLTTSEKKAVKLIQNTFLALDRYREELFANLLAVLFNKTFGENIFSVEEYNILMFDIENMHPYLGLKTLKCFYDFDKELKSKKNDEVTKEKVLQKLASLSFAPLITTNLVVIPGGGAYFDDPGGGRISELGKKFYENVVLCVKENV